MRRGVIRYVIMLAAMVVVAACNVTKRLPEGEFLLSKVTFEEDKSAPREERITVNRDDLESYVRQSPNKRILGIDFYVSAYQKADPDKDNWWNNLLRKMGEEPVLLNDEATERSIINLETYLRTRGYFSSSVECVVDTTRRPKRAEVTYILRQGEPTYIDTLSYNFVDESLRAIILADTAATLLGRGDVMDITRLDAERQRITKNLNNRGYVDFTVNNISYRVDTLGHPTEADVTMIIRPMLVRVDERGQQVWENNAVYRLRNINVYPTYDPMLRSTKGFNPTAQIDTTYYYGLTIIRDKNSTPQLRDAVLRRAIPLYPNYIYNADLIDHTNQQLLSMGFFRNSKIEFERVPGDETFVTFVDDETSEMHDTRERYIDCNIYCGPALKQSIKAELEASSTSTFFGIGATLGYSNRNIFRGAEALDVAARFGYEFMYGRDVKKRSAQEFSFTASLSFPRILGPVNPSSDTKISQARTHLELAFDYQNRAYYSRNIFTTRWAYSWTQGEYGKVVIRPVDINWIDVKEVDEQFFADIGNEYLRSSFEPQLNAGLSASYTYNTRGSDINQFGTFVRSNLECSGNLIHGLETLFSHPVAGDNFYEILGVRYSQYVRAEINASHNIDLGHNMALAGRLFAGVGVTYGNSAGRSIPFDRMFYCGGANSMRGWAPRTLGPGNNPRIMDVAYPAQVGDVRLEVNAEFRFPIWWIFNGAVFLDVGNIWYLRDTEDSNPEDVFHFDSFYRQLGLNTGFGLRLDVSFVVLRFDLGIQLHNPGMPEGQRWIHNFKWDNMALNFGVGYPF